MVRETNHIRAKRDDDMRMLRGTYYEYAMWTERGIMADLRQLHGIENPSLELLQTIARCIMEVQRGNCLMLGIEFRSKMLLIGWFNRNYEMISELIGRIVITDDAGLSTGPMASKFDEYCEQHPDCPIVRDLRGVSADESVGDVHEDWINTN
jgi:hypothetical protein